MNTKLVWKAQNYTTEMLATKLLGIFDKMTFDLHEKKIAAKSTKGTRFLDADFDD